MSTGEAHPHHHDNYRAFASELPRILPANFGRFALVVSGVIKGIYDTNREALREAKRSAFSGGASVLRIEPQPAQMGFLDRADDPREVEETPLSPRQADGQ